MSYILILGASSDISVALSRKYAVEGYNLYLAGRNTEKLKPIKTDLQIRYKVKAEVLHFDGINYETHKAFVDALQPLPDITICVFGYMINEDIASSSWKETHKMLDANFIGPISILSHISNKYVEVGKGKIIGISSVAGERGRKTKLVYGSAKAGFTAYLDGLRNKLSAYNIHVMTVKPGFVYTKMTENLDLPKLLTASPEEVANAIYKGAAKKKNTLYVKWFWKYIMLIIKNIPESIFKKLSI